MRFVLCDDDAMFRSMVESIVTGLGHEVVGVADGTAGGASLVASARPDVVIIDFSVGYNTDFDVIQSAENVGTTVVVFSKTANERDMSRYKRHPIVVQKPDLVQLEEVCRQLGRAPQPDEAHLLADRRVRPARAADGPPPNGPSDAAAFYEAMNSALEGDALLEIANVVDGMHLGERLQSIVRSTDRVLALASSVKVFLPAGADDALASLTERMAEMEMVPPGAITRSIVVRAGESGPDAFTRLRE